MENEQIDHLNICYLYVDEDKEYFTAFHKHLTWIRKDMTIHEYTDIPAGEDAQEQLRKRIEIADIIILLISSSLNDADEYNNEDVQALLKDHKRKNARVWPIILKPVYWKESPFKDFDIFWGREKAVTENTADISYSKIAEKLDWEIALFRSEKVVDVGNWKQHQGDMDGALRAYERSLEYTPGYPPALLGKGRLLRKLKRHEEANRCFENALLFNNSPFQQKGKADSHSMSQQMQRSLDCSKGYAQLELGKILGALDLFKEICQKIPIPTDELQEAIYTQACCGEVEAYLRLAEDTFDDKYHNEVIALYNKAHNFLRQQSRYLVLIGETYTRLGTKAKRGLPKSLSISSPSHPYYEQALNIYEQVLNNDPNNAPAYTGRGNLFYCLQSYVDALKSYETAIHYDRYEVHAHSGRGQVLLKLGNPQEALASFEQALGLEKEEVTIYIGKGQAQVVLGHYQHARDTYKQALDHGLKSLDLLVAYAETVQALAEIAKENQQEEQASYQFNEAFQYYLSILKQQHCEKDRIHVNLGKIHFASGEWRRALQCYEEALHNTTSCADAYLELGKMYGRLGDTNNAMHYLERAETLCAYQGSRIDKADVFVAYGEVEQYLAEQSDAKNYYIYVEKAIKHYQESNKKRANMKAYIGMGESYAKLHRHDDAISALNQALEFNPSIAKCYYLKGKCYYEMGAFAEAINCYNAACDHGMNTTEVLNVKGEAILAMKRYFDANEIFDIIIRERDDKTVYCNKAIALSALGRYEEAIRCFERAKNKDKSICSVPHIRRVLEDMERLISIRLYHNPQDVSAYEQKGDILMLLEEKIEEAVEAYTKFLEEEGMHVDVYYARGKAYILLQEYEKALQDLKVVASIDPTYQNVQQRKAEIEMLVAQHKPLIVKLFSWLKM